MLVGATVALVSLIVLLAVPLGVDFDVSWHGRLERRVDLIWAFGLVRKRLGSADTTGQSAPRQARKSRKPPRARSRLRRAHVLAALRTRAFRRRLSRCIASLWRAVRKDRVSVELRLGLGDPADTGRLWAFVGPCAGLLQELPDVAVSIEPDFHDASFELDSIGMLRVVPLNVILIVAALFLSPAFWRGIRVVRRGA